LRITLVSSISLRSGAHREFLQQHQAAAPS
jgi:hypothetical protein